jgi:hypothetical protein
MPAELKMRGCRVIIAASGIMSSIMTREIHPLALQDLSDLGRFLVAGFHAPPDADFAAPEVLRWKYLEPRGEDDEAPRSYLARDEEGRIIGHVGICRTTFEGGAMPGVRIATLHMIDWLGSPEHRSVGASLMRKAYEKVPTQFGLGGSDAARVIGNPTGYAMKDPVPVYQRVLRPLHWLRVPALGFAARGSRLARDLVRKELSPARLAQIRVELRQVSSFGVELEPITERAKTHVILTGHNPKRLNHLLQFPRQAMSGWQLIVPPNRLYGFAVLNLIPQHGGRVRLGKIVDCLLVDTDVRLWHGAILALTQELGYQGADFAQTFASTPWMAEALQRSGFSSRFALEFMIRDRQKLLPVGIPFHLMPIEADYAYT